MHGRVVQVALALFAAACGEVPLEPYEVDPHECETPYQLATVSFEFFAWGDDEEFSGTCTIVEPTSPAPLVIEMSLSCYDGVGRSLELKGIEGASELVGAFHDGEAVAIEWIDGSCFECPDQQWITIRDADGQLLAWGVDAQRWLPPAGEIAMPFPHPMSIDLDYGFCEALADVCGTRELASVEVALGAETVSINSNEHGVIGQSPSFAVQAGAVQYYSDLEAEECERAEPYDIQLIAIRR